MPNCVQILYPVKQLRTRTSIKFTKVHTIRINRKKFEKIKEVAAQLGVSPNYFICWCAYQAAIGIEGCKNKDN